MCVKFFQLHKKSQETQIFDIFFSINRLDVVRSSIQSHCRVRISISLFCFLISRSALTRRISQAEDQCFLGEKSNNPRIAIHHNLKQSLRRTKTGPESVKTQKNGTLSYDSRGRSRWCGARRKKQCESKREKRRERKQKLVALRPLRPPLENASSPRTPNALVSPGKISTQRESSPERYECDERALLRQREHTHIIKNALCDDDDVCFGLSLTCLPDGVLARLDA